MIWDSWNVSLCWFYLCILCTLKMTSLQVKLNFASLKYSKFKFCHKVLTWSLIYIYNISYFPHNTHVTCVYKTMYIIPCVFCNNKVIYSNICIWNRDKICALKTCHQPFQNKSILKCLTEIFMCHHSFLIACKNWFWWTKNTKNK